MTDSANHKKLSYNFLFFLGSFPQLPSFRFSVKQEQNFVLIHEFKIAHSKTKLPEESKDINCLPLSDIYATYECVFDKKCFLAKSYKGSTTKSSYLIVLEFKNFNFRAINTKGA